MEANDIESFVGNGGFVVLEEPIQVLVVSPGHHQILYSTIWFIHSILGAGKIQSSFRNDR